MLYPVVASLALFATSVSALGSAAVVNQCPYDVYLYDVPASGGGAQESDHTLHTGDSWSQQWTELSNGAGWSIKLSKDTALSNIMQYEYTYQTLTPDIIWYDLSDVNGNPWESNWEVSAEGDSCDPKDQAYRFATDDAYGMQSCSADSTITVTLCSGSDADNSTAPASSVDSPAPAATTVAAVSYSAPATSAQTTEAAGSIVQAADFGATTVETTVVATEAPAPTTTVEAAPTTTTEAPAPTTTVEAVSTTTTAAAAPDSWTGPWTHWGLGANGAVVAEEELPGLAKKDAAAAPSPTTFATFVSTRPAVAATGIAGRLARRHDHGVHRHHQHHAA